MKRGSATFSFRGHSVVPEASFGLIVEGSYDEPVYDGLLRRLVAGDVCTRVRICGGITNLMRLLPAYLRELEHAIAGLAVDKVLVIADSGGKKPAEVEAEMAARIPRRAYAFASGVQLCAVQRTMETWLLADELAISTVASRRSGREVPYVQGDLESIQDPKAILRKVLSSAKLDYLPAVCGAIVKESRLEKLRYRCPSFGRFEQKVHDC